MATEDDRCSAAELASEADVARLRRAQDERSGLRCRARCKRIGCAKLVAPTKRSHAIYCSRYCALRARADARGALQSEVTQEMRTIAMTGRGCATCGKPLKAATRGPLPNWCSRCVKSAKRDQERQRQRLQPRICIGCGRTIMPRALGPLPNWCSRTCYQTAYSKSARRSRRAAFASKASEDRSCPN